MSGVEGRQIHFVMIWGRDTGARIRVEAMRNRENFERARTFRMW